jgi:hypothetical protein
LGAIPNDPSTHDRLQFWQHANAKLAKLANLIDSTTQTKLRSEIHGHIPLPTADEQRQIQTTNAQVDAQSWNALHDLNAADAQGHRALADRAAKTATEVIAGKQRGSGRAGSRHLAAGARLRLRACRYTRGCNRTSALGA